MAVRTGIDIRNNNLRALIRKQPRAFSANSLTRTCNNRDLASQHTLRVVEVASDLVDTLGSRHADGYVYDYNDTKRDRLRILGLSEGMQESTSKAF